MNTTTYFIEQVKRSLLKLKLIHILTILKKLIIKIPNLTLGIMLEYQNRNIFAKGYTPLNIIGLKKVL